ncbi:deoxyribonuclease IV [Anaerotignum sp. MB30-C6]|uniref:deoxyribonuclease IV n=1 Tax=Anaerotignum sp. MB30-C6 TaxID=3070814 RepID=UPI0027DC0520|nr:deoxyribonuclease IV [Anaerotignum sp. MB30-C6]WMI81316.1 deoxyribonuclease IV [Anaerotignum sp. MB30-C6]
MFWIGCHLSASKGYLAMGKEAEKIGANVFQFFTRNPRGGNVKALDKGDIDAYIAFAQQRGFGTLLAHAPYTMNACSADEGLRGFALRMMEEDLERLELLPHVLYNFHPGSHVKQGVEAGVGMITDMLNEVLEKGGKTPILLETMAGKGSEVGRSFEEIRQIIDGVGGHERMGVCLDTCHVYDGGYDIVENLDGVLDEFDQIIGLKRLKAIHLNDSKNPMGSHKDRHEKIGEGTLGLEGITRIINHPKLVHLPFYLETPNELDGYAKEIALLKELRKEG